MPDSAETKKVLLIFLTDDSKPLSGRALCRPRKFAAPQILTDYLIQKTDPEAKKVAFRLLAGRIERWSALSLNWGKGPVRLNHAPAEVAVKIIKGCIAEGSTTKDEAAPFLRSGLQTFRRRPSEQMCIALVLGPDDQQAFSAVWYQQEKILQEAFNQDPAAVSPFLRKFKTYRVLPFLNQVLRKAEDGGTKFHFENPATAEGKLTALCIAELGSIVLAHLDTGKSPGDRSRCLKALQSWCGERDKYNKKAAREIVKFVLENIAAVSECDVMQIAKLWEITRIPKREIVNRYNALEAVRPEVKKKG